VGAVSRRRVRPQVPRAIPLNAEETLFETGSREVWQALLVTADGAVIGPVVRQVIEPRLYTIRYLVVYDLERDRHILLPSNTVVDIADGRVHSNLSREQIAGLPAFHQKVNRSYEEALYRAVGRTPYWLEEQAAMGQPPPDGDDS